MPPNASSSFSLAATSVAPVTGRCHVSCWPSSRNWPATDPNPTTSTCSSHPGSTTWRRSPTPSTVTIPPPFRNTTWPPPFVAAVQQSTGSVVTMPWSTGESSSSAGGPTRTSPGSTGTCPASPSLSSTANCQPPASRSGWTARSPSSPNTSSVSGRLKSHRSGPASPR